MNGKQIFLHFEKNRAKKTNFGPIFSIFFDIFLSEYGYKYISSPRTYDDAQEFCINQYNGTLAIIRNMDENLFAYYTIPPDERNVFGVFIGINDCLKQGEWIYVTGKFMYGLPKKIIFR